MCLPAGGDWWKLGVTDERGIEASTVGGSDLLSGLEKGNLQGQLQSPETVNSENCRIVSYFLLVLWCLAYAWYIVSKPLHKCWLSGEMHRKNAETKKRNW